MFKNIFISTVYKTKLNFNTQSLVEFAYDIKKNNEAKHISNEGGFHSCDLDMSQEPLKDVCEEVLHEGNFYCKYLKIAPCKLSMCWLNINGHKDYNVQHHHIPSFLSAVYYIKVPERSGNIVFINPANVSLSCSWNKSNVIEYNEMNSSQYSMEPLDNELYIFPSFLEHFVKPNLSQKNRISFAFNFEVDF